MTKRISQNRVAFLNGFDQNFQQEQFAAHKQDIPTRSRMPDGLQYRPIRFYFFDAVDNRAGI